MGGRGTRSLGQIAIDATANPTPSPTAHLAGRTGCFEVLVIRPVLFSTTRQQRAVGRNLALDTVASIGIGVTVALVTTLLPTIARGGGLEPLGLAALAAAPFIANLLGAFAGRVGPRSRRQ